MGVGSVIEAQENSQGDNTGHIQGDLTSFSSWVGPSRTIRAQLPTWLDCLQSRDSLAAAVEGAPLTWNQQRDIVDGFYHHNGLICHGLAFQVFFQWGWAIVVPLWCAAAFISVRHLVRLWRAADTFMSLRAGRCPSCFYATAGLDPHAPCPECGTDPNVYRRQKLAVLDKDKGGR